MRNAPEMIVCCPQWQWGGVRTDEASKTRKRITNLFSSTEPSSAHLLLRATLAACLFLATSNLLLSSTASVASSPRITMAHLPLQSRDNRTSNSTSVITQPTQLVMSQPKRSIHVEIVGYDSRNATEAPFSHLMMEHMVNYSRSQGYKYHRFSDNMLRRGAPSPAANYSPKFNKYAYILQLFERNNNDTRAANEGNYNSRSASDFWCAWVDSDVWIVEGAFRWEHVIEIFAHEGTNLILGRDHRPYKNPVNNGVFLIRNSAWSRRLLNLMIHNGPQIHPTLRKYFAPGLVDQPVLCYFLHDVLGEIQFPPNKNSSSNINEPEMARHVSIVPTRAMNSFCRPRPKFLVWNNDENANNSNNNNEAERTVWHPGDAIVHFTGLTESQRIKVFQAFLSRRHGHNNKQSSYNPCLDETILARPRRIHSNAEMVQGIGITKQTRSKTRFKIKRSAL